MADLTQTPRKPVKVPLHYQIGQEPTAVGARIHADLGGIDFTKQVHGGPNLTFYINKNLFKPRK